MQNTFKVKGQTISGKDIMIDAIKDCERFGSFIQSYWADIRITLNGIEYNTEDLTDRNTNHIIEQLPYL